MVVECRKCGTRFQLDAARIPDTGIRVRCSRCKHAFFLKHPEQSEAESVEAVVEEAVRSESAPPPAATRDLGVAENESSAGAQTVAAANDDFIDDEEDDWEFNEDLPPYDDEDDVSDEGFAAPALGHEDANEMSIELADDGLVADDVSEPEIGLADAGHAATDSAEMSANDLMASSLSVDAAEASPFDAVGDDPDDIPIATAVSDDESDAMPETVEGVREQAFGSVEDFSSLAAPEEPAPSAPADVGAAPSDEENIEDPESWDFFSDGQASQDAPCTPADPFGAALPASVGAEHEGDALEDAVSSQDWPKLGENRAASAAGRIFNALGWVLVCSMIGLGAFLGLRDTFDPSVHAPAFVSIGEMRAANVKGQWVETTEMGTLYVVSGDLLNPGTQAQAPSLAIEVQLMDEAGGVADWPVVRAGRSVEFDVLRTLPADELAALRERTMHDLAWGEIPGGESVRFAAVFETLPDAAARFQLAAATIETAAPVAPTANPEAPAVDEASKSVEAGAQG